MIVKKRNLTTVCVALSMSVIVATAAISAYVRKVSENRERQKLMDKYNRAIDREYQDRFV